MRLPAVFINAFPKANETKGRKKKEEEKMWKSCTKLDWEWGWGSHLRQMLQCLAALSFPVRRHSQELTRAWGGGATSLLYWWFICYVYSLLYYELDWFYSKLTWDHKRNILLDCHMFGRETGTEWPNDSPRTTGLEASCFRNSWRNVQYWTEKKNIPLCRVVVWSLCVHSQRGCLWPVMHQNVPIRLLRAFHKTMCLEHYTCR